MTSKGYTLPATLDRVQAQTNAGTFTWGVGGELRLAEPPPHPLCPPADWNGQREMHRETVHK